MQRRGILTGALLAAWAAAAQTAAQPVSEARPDAPPELRGELQAARLQGSGRLRFIGLRIYDAQLWVGEQSLTADWAATPFALSLIYARELKSEPMAERSLSEMKRQGDIASETAQRWLTLMKQLLPDVKAGDRITGVNLPTRGVRFFVNGTLRSETPDAEFARKFFGIWLSPRTSEPALREALLGRAAQ